MARVESVRTAKSAVRGGEAVVLHVGGQYWASEKAVVEAALERPSGRARRRGQPVAQTATVTFDPQLTSVEQLRRLGRASAASSAPAAVGARPHVRPAAEPADRSRRLRPRGGRSAPKTPHGPRARRARRHVDGAHGCATCATASCRARLHTPDLACGRWSARACSAPSSRRRSESTATCWQLLLSLPSSSTPRRSSSRARSRRCASGRWT